MSIRKRKFKRRARVLINRFLHAHFLKQTIGMAKNALVCARAHRCRRHYTHSQYLITRCSPGLIDAYKVVCVYINKLNTSLSIYIAVFCVYFNLFLMVVRQISTATHRMLKKDTLADVLERIMRAEP